MDYKEMVISDLYKKLKGTDQRAFREVLDEAGYTYVPGANGTAHFRKNRNTLTRGESAS